MFHFQLFVILVFRGLVTDGTKIRISPKWKTKSSTAMRQRNPKARLSAF